MKPSANTIALICVGLVALAAIVTLALASPSPQGSPLTARSSSAVGFAGAVALLRDLDVSVTIGPGEGGLNIYTPEPSPQGLDPTRFPDTAVLVVLPKWRTRPDPRRPGWVRNAGVLPPDEIDPLLSRLDAKVRVARQPGTTRELRLNGAVGPVRIDHLQTLRGEGWRAILTAPDGALVLGSPPGLPDVLVLADPDLLNTHGVAKVENAGLAVDLLTGAGEKGPVHFLNTPRPGTRPSQNPLPVLFRAPMLAVTLCALAALLLMVGQALVRFGAAAKEGRAVALGPEALVESSAGLVRMARKEHQLAPAYLDLNEAAVARSAGFDRAPGARARLDELGRRKGVSATFSDLVVDAARAANRGDLMKIARRIHAWRQEMTRERR